MAFVNDDHVEEVGGELREPAIRGARELLDVGDDESRSRRSRECWRPRPLSNRHVRAVLEVGQHPGLGPEALDACDIESLREGRRGS